ncbi:hypothetical protein E2C01_098819 [Portunus trituberculatus]|uniref:Uncharacterized protein n=1 Tax=Portunus trituberculatus TaxID=210409 RepID=A0A5B7K976_PORTR|nr:hypothetical protein [Portunus trituberculatus]
MITILFISGRVCGGQKINGQSFHYLNSHHLHFRLLLRSFTLSFLGSTLEPFCLIVSHIPGTRTPLDARKH